MKNKLISGILCFCVLLSSIGCGPKTEDIVQLENTVQAEDTVQPKDNAETDVIIEDNQGEQAQEQPEERDYYEELIAVARECAIKNNGEKPEGYDFSGMLYMKKEWDYGTLGYLIKDIDGNGTDELIFGGNADESVSWYDGIIYDIYTISDGELVHVLDGWERSRYFFCENGIIAHEGSGSAFDGTNSYFTLEGAELHLVESVTWNYEGWRDAYVYYYTTESEYDTENAEIISMEQSDAIIEKYVYEHIAFIPFNPPTTGQSKTEGKELEDEIVNELTMETLLELYENDDLKLKVEEEGLDGFLAYGNMKPLSGREDSLTGLYICDLVYTHTFENGITSARNYELQLSYWRPKTAEEYGHTENEIDNIRLMEKESQDAVLLYEVDERFTPTKDLQGFLQRDYGIEQYLLCDLPSDFTLGAFQTDIAFYDGWLLEGEVEEPPHDEGISEAWYCPGGIGRRESASQILKFESGTLTDAALMMNHTEQLGETEILEGCEVQAVLLEYAFDLFTASGWENYLSQNPEAEEVLNSHYWYVFMGKEDSDIFYVLFLNQEHFTKDDVIRMAQSVQFTERAF